MERTNCTFSTRAAFTAKTKWLSGVVIGLLLALLLAGCSSSGSGTPSVPAGTAQVAAGANHTVALKNDGTVWAWGLNTFGQLGNGTTTDSTTPLQVLTGAAPVQMLTGVVAIAAGDAHTVALKKDGTVWAWGDNSFDQLGVDPTTIQSTTPVQVLGFTVGVKIIAIAAGANHTVALDNNGKVWAWGNNDNGQLGIDPETTGQSAIPVQIAGLTGVTAIAAGTGHTVALEKDGTVWALGDNDNGQLGDTNASRFTPVSVSGLTGVTAIAAGAFHTVALKNDGTVLAWGSNSFGQLGDGSLIDSATPVSVSGLTGVKIIAIAAGVGHTVALKNDGTILDWGDNSSGQLGNGITLAQSSTPVPVSGLAGMVAITAGSGHTVALKKDGTVWAWGANNGPQLGNTDTTGSAAPSQVSGLTGVFISVAAGNSHTVALKDDGTAWAWGSNGNGQLGDSTTTDRIAPVQVSGLTGVTAIAAGAGHTVAMDTNGAVWAWGANNLGQLGIGTTTNSPIPVQVSGFTPGVKIIAIAAGAGHTVALDSNKNVWAWGDNTNGQLGIGIPPTQSTTPVQVTGLAGVTAIAAGAHHTVASDNNGAVWAWGSNSFGQLGIGGTTQSAVPMQVSVLTGATAVAAGASHTVALKNDGTVWAWGNNGNGRLGNGTTAESHIPISVSGLTGATAVAAGNDHTVARKTDGTVWAWGGNSTGQLGNGTNTDSPIPVSASGLTGGTHVAAGFGFTVALKTDGTIWAWGNNGNALLGIGWTQVQSLINLGVQ
jgi:alpha-tubulin suppressor-like RCC1 family protein